MTPHLRNTLFKAILPLALILAAPRVPAQSGTINKHLYSETADPKADIAAAETVARRDHKRILLQFGGNWCGDCLVLDSYYHQAPNDAILAKHYVIVHVDIGQMDHNIDTATKYHVPVTKGVPALAILDANGKLLYSERPKEFEHTSPQAVTALLNQWKG